MPREAEGCVCITHKLTLVVIACCISKHSMLAVDPQAGRGLRRAGRELQQGWQRVTAWLAEGHSRLAEGYTRLAEGYTRLAESYSRAGRGSHQAGRGLQQAGRGLPPAGSREPQLTESQEWHMPAAEQQLAMQAGLAGLLQLRAGTILHTRQDCQISVSILQVPHDLHDLMQCQARHVEHDE